MYRVGLNDTTGSACRLRAAFGRRISLNLVDTGVWTRAAFSTPVLPTLCTYLSQVLVPENKTPNPWHSRTVGARILVYSSVFFYTHTPIHPPTPPPHAPHTPPITLTSFVPDNTQVQPKHQQLSVYASSWPQCLPITLLMSLRNLSHSTHFPHHLHSSNSFQHRNLCPSLIVQFGQPPCRKPSLTSPSWVKSPLWGSHRDCTSHLLRVSERMLQPDMAESAPPRK